MANRFFPNYDEYIITSPFGPRGSGYHYGIDLVAKDPNGGGQVDVITAHTGGIVFACGYSETAGNFIQIKTDYDTIMAYYHFLDRLPWKSGDVIKPGTVLGMMGSTGRSNGAHLHFGIKHRDVWVDPNPYLDKDFSFEEPIAAKQYVSCSVPVLRVGDRGDSVWAMQTLLIMHGFSCGNSGADGIFGNKTAEALEKFRNQYGLSVDRICDTESWENLLGV